jgi:hypothetical protein
MKASRTDAVAIRHWAQIQTRIKGIRIEAGERYNVADDRRANLNIRLVSDDPDWNDTDLNDFVDWASFLRTDIQPDAQGRVLVDFYISSLGPHAEMQDNVQAEWIDGVLTRITAGLDGELWRRT